MSSSRISSKLVGEPMKSKEEEEGQKEEEEEEEEGPEEGPEEEEGTYLYATTTSLGARTAQCLEHRTRDRKTAGSNPSRTGGSFYSPGSAFRTDSFRYPFHPRGIAVARKKKIAFDTRSGHGAWFYISMCVACLFAVRLECVSGCEPKILSVLWMRIFRKCLFGSGVSVSIRLSLFVVGYIVRFL